MQIRTKLPKMLNNVSSKFLSNFQIFALETGLILFGQRRICMEDIFLIGRFEKFKHSFLASWIKNQISS
tara:strand:+ start:138 stop:344 length:207 start_codon:yes stop_codon:yes gene_type:complete